MHFKGQSWVRPENAGAWKISNSDIQQLFGLDVKQASYKLSKIRNAYAKTSVDDVRCFELYEQEKLDIETVSELLGWKNR